MRLGELIREERKKRRWSLKELGERLTSPRDGGHVSPQYLNDLEMGRRSPSDEILQQLAKLLKQESAFLRALAEKGVPELDEYLADQPEQGSSVGRLFRKARENGFTDWHQFEQQIPDKPARKKK